MSGKIKELLKQPKYAAAWTLIKTGLALTLVLAIFLNIDKTLGWFSNNTEVDANGMAVNVDAPEGVVESVEYYKVTAISSATSNEVIYNVYEFGTKIDERDAQLATFSELIALRQIMIKVTLKNDVQIARVYATTETKNYITDAALGIQADKNPLSSIVDIRVATVAQYENNIYKISDQNATALHFAQPVKNDGLTTGFTFNQQTDTITINDLDKSAQCIYIIIDYYEESTAYVMEVVNALLMDGKIELGTNSQISFACDFTICIS